MISAFQVTLCSYFVSGFVTVQAMYKTAELQLYEILSIRFGR